MKKLLITCTFTLTFFFSGAVGFSDILKDLDKFQKSLGDWVTQIDELNSRISNMERDKVSSEKKAEELNRGLANIENLLSDLDAKVDRVANMSSLEGVKEIVKSFEGTLNVFKKRFSELAKRIEDQEVKTAVLERMYKTANKPLDTLMQAIDGQKGVIDKLGDKLETQEALILSMKESLQKQTDPSESLVNGIEKLNSRLSKLESGVLVQAVAEEGKHEEEKHVAAPTEHDKTHEEVHEEVKHVAASPAEAEHIDAHEEAKHVAAATAGDHEKVQAHIGKTDLVDIGEGFFVKNIKFGSFGSSSQIRGEIVNKSDKNHGMIEFKVQAYDKENVSLGGQGFSVYGFHKGITKPFEEVIVGVTPKQISKYSIYPTRMPLVSETGESTVKIIAMKSAVAAATKAEETMGQKPDNLKNLMFEEQVTSTPKVLEGLEEVGNGFYAGNVSFNGFGSSSSMTGSIKNNSEKDFYNVSFVMKVYSKSYGMITSLDFSVRNINGGETKTFEEIITGVQAVDIDRYEIAFKSSY